MRFSSSVLGRVLEGIDRREFGSIVARHDGDAYDKRFDSWQHLTALIFAQLGSADSLRGLEAGWNAQRQHHYHLGGGMLHRSTLSDANQRRPAAVFAELLERLSARLSRQVGRQSREMIRLLDSTPVPLGRLSAWAKTNGRIRGMKVHVLYDPRAEAPQVLAIADANVNDVEIGRAIAIAPGTTYVFDKGYCHYGWWTRIAEAKAVFVTRPKTNMGLKELVARPLPERSAAEIKADGFTLIEDAEVALDSKGDSKLPVALRRITLRRPVQPGSNGREIITLITNDLVRPAVEIAALYKGRWQIELLFRWIKQHLKIRTFLGRSENAVRLQILAAMIAFVLIRLAARSHGATLAILRFVGLVSQCLLPAPRPQGDPQTSPRQSKPAKTQNQPQPDRLPLCLKNFPGQPCARRGEASALDEAEPSSGRK